MDDCGVYRDDALLTAAQAMVRELRERYAKVAVDDKGTVFNTDLLEVLELGCLLDWPRRPSRPPSPARRAVAPIPARTSPTATTSTSWRTRWRRRRRAARRSPTRR